MPWSKNDEQENLRTRQQLTLVVIMVTLLTALLSVSQP